MSPENRLDLLFDDVLFEDVARREHLQMCAVIDAVVGRPDAVLQIGQVIRETFDAEDARLDFVEHLCRAMDERNYRAYEQELRALSPDDLHAFAITGVSKVPLHDALPIPNLMFTRDLCAVVGRHVILSYAATEARRRESLLIRTVMHHHHRFAPYRDRVITLPPHVTFEGGDLLVVNEETVLIGHSERTSLGGVLNVTRVLFERTGVQHVLVVDIPKKRSSMHLDTVFTLVGRNEAVVYPPLIEKDSYNVMRFRRGSHAGSFSTEILPNLRVALDELMDAPLTYIPCGGADRLIQRREQWTDGANLFALEPGVVLGYERNRHTFDILREYGYRIVDAESFLSYHRESPYQRGDKIAIKLVGTELSRGRGGPRCMTLPIRREP